MEPKTHQTQDQAISRAPKADGAQEQLLRALPSESPRAALHCSHHVQPHALWVLLLTNHLQEGKAC